MQENTRTRALPPGGHQTPHPTPTLLQIANRGTTLFRNRWSRLCDRPLKRHSQRQTDTRPRHLIQFLAKHMLGSHIANVLNHIGIYMSA